MADIVDKFSVRFWEGSFYANVRFPDGTHAELKSDSDLTYAQWQAKITAAWEAKQLPPDPPPRTPLTEYTDTEIRDEAVRRGLMTEGMQGLEMVE